MKHELRSVSTPADWQAMHEIRRVTLFTEERHPGLAYDENHPLDRDPANQPLLLLLDGTPIGVVRLDWREPDAVVRLVGIVPHLQGGGHGRAMSELVDAAARRRGVTRLLVNAYRGALGFYERTGWRREEWDAAELTGFAGDCIQMTKSIAG